MICKLMFSLTSANCITLIRLHLGRISLIMVNALCNISDIYLGEIANLEQMVRVYAVCIADRNV